MPTSRDIVVRALLRLRIVAPGEAVEADYASVGLDALNALVLSWAPRGIVIAGAPWLLTDTAEWPLPPVGFADAAIAALSDDGAWDAAQDIPSLGAEIAVAGSAHRVSVAGTTALSGMTPWIAGDWVLSDGDRYWKGLSSAAHERALVDLLALDLSATFGREPLPGLVAAARSGWHQIQAAFIRAPNATFDASLLAISRYRAGITAEPGAGDTIVLDLDGGSAQG